jgi:ABC-2 type transport system ATP-binding protein
LGKTIVISSHFLEDLEEICDRVAVIEHGRVVVQGALGDLKRQLNRARKYVVEPRDKVEEVVVLLEQHPEAARDVLRDGRFVRFAPPENEDAARALRLLLDANVSLRAFREEETALAEVFLELTRGEIA